MKTLIISVCLLGGLLMQGCEAYVEPTGGYYVRDNIWYYRDVHGAERHEHGRYHHRPEDEHRNVH